MYYITDSVQNLGSAQNTSADSSEIAKTVANIRRLQENVMSVSIRSGNGVAPQVPVISPTPTVAPSVNSQENQNNVVSISCASPQTAPAATTGGNQQQRSPAAASSDVTQKLPSPSALQYPSPGNINPQQQAVVPDPASFNALVTSFPILTFPQSYHILVILLRVWLREGASNPVLWVQPDG